MDAFGYNALSGFLGSSNIKSNKQRQLRYLDSLLKKIHKKLLMHHINQLMNQFQVNTLDVKMY